MAEAPEALVTSGVASRQAGGTSRRAKGGLQQQRFGTAKAPPLLICWRSGPPTLVADDTPRRIGTERPASNSVPPQVLDDHHVDVET